jgi:hypothetical protein
MKVAPLALLLFIAVSSFAEQQEDQQRRIIVATNWLYSLCVVPNGDFQAITPIELRDAFEAWAKSNQDTAQCEPKAFKATKPASPLLVVEVSSIRLRPWERIARMPQFRTQIQQTPAYVYGVLQGAPANTPSQFFPNPDHSIFSYGGPVHFDELYVGADTRVAICTVLDDLYQKANQENPKANIRPDKRCTDSGYLLANRVRDNFTRIGAAVSLDINFSQVPKFQSPIVITSLSNLNFPEWSKTITGSFDASKLFRSATEMKGIAGYVGKVNLKSNYGVNLMDKNTILRDLCDRKSDELNDPTNTTHCIQAITVGGMAKRLAISILPRIDVKAISPFDLSKYGSSFVAPPNRAGRSLYTVTLNWDLRSLIPSTASRLDALTAIKSLHDSEDKPPLDDKKIREALWRRQVAASYLELRSMPERSLDPVWWSRFEAILMRTN